MEKPRYVIIGLQTDRKNSLKKDMSKFDSCNIRSVKLWLNSEVYPYESTNIDFTKQNQVFFYDQYLRFKNSYYGQQSQSLFDFEQYTTVGPLFVIDCSHQNESIKAGSVDLRVEIQSNEDFPDRTTAYALILNDKVIEYNPSRNLVRKL